MGEEQAWEARWQVLAAAAFAELKAWRQGHPTATLRDIELAMDERLAVLRARMLQDIALASAAADLRAVPAAERPVCPHCGGQLRLRGQQQRQVTTSHEQPVVLTRSYAECPTCRVGLFPPG